MRTVTLLLLAALAHGEEFSKRVEALARPYAESGVVHSMSVAVYRRGDAEPLFFGFGKGEPGADTIYEIGSVSKVFTGSLLAVLAGEGRVTVEQPAQELLPEGVTMPVRNEKPLRLVDLATHSSGLPRMPGNFAPADPNNPYADYTVEQMYAFLGGHELSRARGVRYEYSNLGAGLLGHLLAGRAGTSYEGLLQTRIAEPLGMKSTAIALDETLRARLAPGHNADGEPVANWDLPTFAGAGAIRSSARDVMVFLRASLDPADDALGRALASAREIRFRPEAAGSHAVGLGWHVAPGGKVWWHNGQTGGYHSFVAIEPERGTAVVVLGSSAVRQIDEMGWKLVALLGGADPEPFEGRKVVEVAPEILQRYAGTYQVQPGFDFTITLEKKRLMAKLPGQAKYRIYPESPTRFFYRVVDAQITFVEKEGAVTGLVLHQGGRDLKAKKTG